MVSLRGVLCSLLVGLTPMCAAHADSTNQEIPKELKGKIVFLRGMEAGDKLSFDSQGAEMGSYQTGPFAYSAIKVEKIRLSDAQLEIDGERAALVFETKSDTPH